MRLSPCGIALRKSFLENRYHTSFVFFFNRTLCFQMLVAFSRWNVCLRSLRTWFLVKTKRQVRFYIFIYILNIYINMFVSGMHVQPICGPSDAFSTKCWRTVHYLPGILKLIRFSKCSTSSARPKWKNGPRLRNFLIGMINSLFLQVIYIELIYRRTIVLYNPIGSGIGANEKFSIPKPAMALMREMLKYDPDKRIVADIAMKTAYFDG